MDRTASSLFTDDRTSSSLLLPSPEAALIQPTEEAPVSLPLLLGLRVPIGPEGKFWANFWAINGPISNAAGQVEFSLFFSVLIERRREFFIVQGAVSSQSIFSGSKHKNSKNTHEYGGYSYRSRSRRRRRQVALACTCCEDSLGPGWRHHPR